MSEPQAAPVAETQATAPADGGKAVEPAAAAATPAAPVVPEKYELKAPDGYFLGQGHLDGIAAYAKEKKLTQEQAQELLTRDHGIAAAEKQKYEQARADEQKAYDKKISDWAAESKADPEIGGDALAKNVELTKRVVAKFFSPEVAKFIDQSGYGNQKEVIRGFVKLIKAAGFAEDTLIVPSAHAPPSTRRTEELFYGKAAE